MAKYIVGGAGKMVSLVSVCCLKNRISGGHLVKLWPLATANSRKFYAENPMFLLSQLQGYSMHGAKESQLRHL